MSEEETIPEPPQAEHRHAYHKEMEDLTNGVIRLGAMACETIPWGTDAVLSGDLGEIQKVIDGDDEIDELSYELEERCVSIIARQAPMAGELRRLITIVKLIGEIERSADLVVNVCKSSRRLYGATFGPHFRGLLAAMGKEANKLLRLSIDAFADGNVSLAAALGDIDDELDQLNRDMIESIFEANVGGELDLGPAVQLALIARYYERIGDHAVNIGERVVYMVTGKSLELAYMHSSDDAAAGAAPPAGGGPKVDPIDREDSEQ